MYILLIFNIKGAGNTEQGRVCHCCFIDALFFLRDREYYLKFCVIYASNPWQYLSMGLYNVNNVIFKIKEKKLIYCVFVSFELLYFHMCKVIVLDKAVVIKRPVEISKWSLIMKQKKDTFTMNNNEQEQCFQAKPFYCQELLTVKSSDLHFYLYLWVKQKNLCKV